jgi:hypothetical protein
MIEAEETNRDSQILTLLFTLILIRPSARESGPTSPDGISVMCSANPRQTSTSRHHEHCYTYTHLYFVESCSPVVVLPTSYGIDARNPIPFVMQRQIGVKRKDRMRHASEVKRQENRLQDIEEEICCSLGIRNMKAS